MLKGVAWSVPSHHLCTVTTIRRSAPEAGGSARGLHSTQPLRRSARRAGVGAGKFSDTLPIRRAGDERR